MKHLEMLSDFVTTVNIAKPFQQTSFHLLKILG